MTHEEERAKTFFQYLEKFPEPVRKYIRGMMQDTLFRDDILNEFSFKKLIGKRAMELQEQYGGTPFEQRELWLERCREAKKQLIDYYFSVNYSIDYLKQLIVNHSTEIESEFNISLDVDYGFIVDVEKASINVLLKKMNYYESLSEEEKSLVHHEMRELKIVLLKRLITEIPEQVRVAERFLSLADLKEIYSRILGKGKVGGKSAGMLMAYKIVQYAEEEDPYNYRDFISIPESYYLGDEVFAKYLDFNGTLSYRNQKFKPNEVIEKEYIKIKETILNGRFPDSIWNQFRELLVKLDKKPIIVRSSSLLEDNIGFSFAGKYDSYFLANQGNIKENLQAFAQAIRDIYSGVFSPDAIAYRKRSKMQYDYESMGILIQEVVGRRIGRYFFPDMAGVIFSENPYIWSKRIRKEDGMIRMVHGLGTRAVDRVGEDYPRMLSLTIPDLRPEAHSDVLKYSQKFIDVIDLKENKFVTVRLQDIIDEDPCALNSYIYSIKTEDMIRQVITNLELMNNTPVITFDKLLAHSEFPFIVRAMIDKIKKFYGHDLDIEFAGLIEKDGKFKLSLLQCRPQSTRGEMQQVTVPEVSKENALFTCNSDVPNCKIENIEYIVYIDPEKYDRVSRISDRYEIARLIGKINKAVEGHTAILLGPGRWGSNNIKLGVPVKYNEINNFRLLGEIARLKSGIIPEVSFGTHFFQDLVESGIHCVPIYPDNPNVIFNEDFFMNHPNAFSNIINDGGYKRFENEIKVFEFRSKERVQVFLDGKTETGTCFLSCGYNDTVSV